MHLLRSALLPLALLCLLGCEPVPPQQTPRTGSVELTLRGPLAAPGDITRVTVTVSAADMAARTIDLAPTQGAWGGVLGDLPTGTGRTFLAQAFTTASTPRYEGRAEDVTVTAGTTGRVSLWLQDVSAPPPFTNESPIIDSLVANPSAVAPGGTVTLTATAHDSDSGDIVSYSWSASAGRFAAPDQASTTWTAGPSVEGPVSLSLQVKDSRGATLSQHLNVHVRPSSGAARWLSTGSMAQPRLNHTATLLSSGKVLVTGSYIELVNYLSSAELYDPITGTWSPTGSMSKPRGTHTALKLPSGKVLVVGGGWNDMSTTAEVYDPATGTWSPTGPLATARNSFQALALLASGKVLITGGEFRNAELATAELYDPDTNTWSLTGSMGTARRGHAAARLSDGRVLVSGGYNRAVTYLKTAEVYDPVTGTWSATGAMLSESWRHAMTLLPTGKVLAVGTGGGGPTAEVYDPVTGTWSGRSMINQRYADSAQATLLATGELLIAGGTYTWSAFREAELYDPVKGAWRATTPMPAWRGDYAAARLADGKVLLVGGSRDQNGREVGLTTAEVYDPGTQEGQ